MSRWFHSSTSIVVLVALGGCSLVPDYQRPDMPIPDTWTTVAGGGEKNAVSPRGAWWCAFNDGHLVRLVDQSLAGSHTLQAAVAKVDEARATAEIAGAPLYPAITIAGASTRGQSLGSSGIQQVGSQGLFAQASYEVDFWGKNRAAAASARSLTSASIFDSETVAITLTASVANTYFLVLSLIERIELARRMVESAKRILTLVEQQAANGIASDLQIEQQRNQVATFEAAIPTLQQQLEQARHLLAVLTGAIPEGFVVAGNSLNGIPLPDVQADLPSTVAEQRPDIQAAEARLISANFDIGAARAALYPSLTLSPQAGLASIGTLTPATPIASIVMGLMQPVFQGGRLEGQLKFDRAHDVELAETYRQTVLTAFQDVEDALSALVHLKEVETTDQVAVESGRRAAQLANTQFQLGASDFLNVLTNERTLYQAEDALRQVRLQRFQAAVGLFRAMGGGFDASTCGSTSRSLPIQPVGNPPGVEAKRRMS
jgi:NodT family efflux transporter outer membrane factor (OMF) lipoprotein